MPIAANALLWLALAATPVVQKEIVVTAARDEQPRDQASAALTVLDRDDLTQLPAASLAELLSFVPGVTMMFDGGASGLPVVTSRGFFGGGEVEYVKLLVDGVPVGDAESGNVDWQRFRAAGIERIEVLHGPGSALYGDTALGGVIQAFTSRAPDGDLHLGGGSFGARELGASYWTDLANGLEAGITAGEWRTGGFREHADADGLHGRLTLERLGDRSRWRVDGEASREDRRQPGALTRDAIAGDREQSDPLYRFDAQQTKRGRLSAAFDSFGRIPLRATLYAMRRDDGNLRTLLLAPGFGSSAFRALETSVGGGTFELSRETARGVVRAGADLERAAIDASYAPVGEDGRRGEPVAAADGRRDRVGLFATGGWTLGRRWHVSTGLRHDEIRDDVTERRTSSAWSPRAGVNVHLGPALSPVTLFVQVSRAFKAPTLDQLFDPRPYPDGTGGTFTISNPGLRPQRARNLEAGLSRTTAWSDWSVVGYRMNVRDEIDFDPRTFTYRNIGTSLHRGLEASAAFAKTARLSVRLAYAWTRVADSASPDLQLKNIPEHTAQVRLHWRATDATSAGLVYRWRDGLALDDEGLFRQPGLSRVDLRLVHDLRNVRLQADVLNALDARYNELGFVLTDFMTGIPAAFEYPAPGRAFRVGLSWTFGRKGS